MKKMTKQFLVSSLVASSLGLASVASAAPFGDGPGKCMRGAQKMNSAYNCGERGFNLDRMSEKLNLTEEQRTQIEAVLEESKQKRVELHETAQVNREQIREFRAQQREKIGAVLTDEQRMQLAEMRGKKPPHRQF